MFKDTAAGVPAPQTVAERALVTAGLMLATLMNIIDSTIANVALPHIQGSVSAAQDQITWVITSYIVATAMMTPLTGWMALKIGRRPLFITSVAAFIIASVACGLATSLPQIVAFRILQGFAGAAMMPLSQAALVDMWPGEMLPRVMSIWSGVIMVGPLLGPTLGGWLTEHYTWRWVFFINVPIGAVSLVLLSLFMRRDDAGRARPFDAMGFVTLVLFIGASQLMVDRGPGQDWFYAKEIWFWAVLAGCAAYIFVIHSATTEHPFFHPDILRDRNYIACVAFNFFVSMVLFSTTTLLPSFMQTLLGYSALQSGLVSMAGGCGSLLSAFIAPSVARWLGPRRTILLGISLAAAALWRMAHFDLSMTARDIMIANFIQGLGSVLMFNSVNVLSYANLASQHRTEGAVFSNVIRTMGGSLGIAILQAFLIRQQATAGSRLAEHLSPGDPILRWSMPGSLDSLQGLARLQGEVTRQGAMIGYVTVFAWMTLAVFLILPPLLLLMKPGKISGPPPDIHEAAVH
jgi:DHA2 family multidrug resistance protein